MKFIDLDERGKTTDYCRALHAKMGSYIGNGARGGCHLPKHRGETSGVMIDEYKVRKLTPKECFRLQGWPDEYFERAKFVNSDSQLYKQAGNGVTVNVIEAIAKRFEEEE